MARRVISNYGPVAAWVAVLLTFAVISLPEAPQPQAWNIDKMRHAAAYALLGALLARAVVATSRHLSTALVAAFFGVCAVGLATEVIQLAVPGRTADVVDWAADITGGLAGAGLFLRGLGPGPEEEVP